MKKIIFLNGMRGWAAFVVVIYHFFVEAFPVTLNSKFLLSHLFFFNGTLAVWIFFIISGFSLTVNFAKFGDRSFLLRIAYGRYFRLAIPIVFFSFLMYGLYTIGAVPPVDQRPNGGWQNILLHPPKIVEVIQFSLFDVFFNYTLATTLIPPLWTMPNEFIGSFLTLIVCAFFGKQKYRILIYILILIITLLLKMYCSAFIAGILFSEIYLKFEPMKHPTFAPIIFLTTGTFLGAQLINPNFYLYPLTSVILFYGMMYVSTIKRFLESNISIFMGKISYTLYMLHAIVMWSFTLPMYIFIKKHELDTPIQIFLLNTISIAIAIFLSYRLVFIDELSISFSHKFSNFMMEMQARILKKIKSLKF